MVSKYAIAEIVQRKCSVSHKTTLNHLNDANITINGSYGLSMKKAKNLLRQIPHLNKLDIHVWDKPINFKTISNTFGTNQNIDNLKARVSGLAHMTVISNKDIQQLVDDHPMLTELEFESFELSSDAILSALRLFKSLREFRFTMDNSMDINSLVLQVGSQWQSSFETFLSTVHVTLKRITKS